MRIGDKTLYSILFIVLLSGNALAQDLPNGELGLQLGGMYYLGEINKVPFKTTKLAGGVFYRHNFNFRYSAKSILSISKVGASDSKSNSEYQKSRNHSFNRMCYGISVLGEFNFLQFASGFQKTPYSTYLQGGVSAFLLPDNKHMESLVFGIPFGFGAKFNANENISYGVDFLMIKTFSDQIDYVSPNSSETNRVKQGYITSNKDWLSYLAIYFAYRIKYPQKCPSFD